MSSERSASFGAWSESARRIGISDSVRRSIPGIQPTVEMAVRRWVMPTSGSAAQASSTLSRFIIGSPIPMKTQWSMASIRRKWSAWSTISAAVRLRPNFIVPVAQKVQVSGQPDWDETQIERRPSR